MKSIIDFLYLGVSEYPERALFTFLNVQGEIVESYTYETFEKRTNFLAAKLHVEGKISFGQRVILMYSPGLEMITAFFACVKIGAIPVPIPPLSRASASKSMDRLAFVAADCGANVILTDKTQEDGIYHWINTRQIQGELDFFNVKINPLLFIQYTSGSTREPRGVMVSHVNVIHNAAIDKQIRPGDPYICVSWLPHYHDMGLIGYHLFMMMAGGSGYYFSALDFLRRPLLWLETITRFAATRTSAPNFAFEYCLREDRLPTETLSSINLSSLKDMMNGSEPVRSQTVKRFLNKFQAYGLHPEALTVAYGLAEHTLAVSCLGKSQLKNNTCHEVSCGAPLPEVDVQIVDPITMQVKAEGEAGEIWVNSLSKAAGYWGKPELSEQIFQARAIGLEQASYLRTGDIGFIQEGELYVSGRLNDMVVIRGANIFPADIEAIVETHFTSIEAGRVVAFGTTHEVHGDSGITVLIEAKNIERIPNLSEIHRTIVDACQIPVHAIAVVLRGSLLKTSSGKLARSNCKALWQNKEMTILGCLKPQEIDGLAMSLEDYLDTLLSMRGYNQDDTVTIGQLGLDSLDLVNLSLKIESLIKQYNLVSVDLQDKLSDLRLLQSIAVKDLKVIAHEIRAGHLDAKIIEVTYTQALQSVIETELAQMRADAILPAEIIPIGNFMQPVQRTVLLTGATGFLGSFLAESLLRLTNDKIIILVRAQSREHAKRRVISALEKAGVPADQLNNALACRLELLCGDIAKSRLGLSEAVWEDLAQRVTTIYHCGAEVDYVKPYETLRAANVLGTQEVLQLTCVGIAKELHYVSTTFIFGWTTPMVLQESECNLAMQGLNFGYSQSKWVAEQLVIEAQKRGLKCKIFRPALITASRNGQYMRGDVSTRAIGYMMRHGVAINAATQLSFLPADVCANNIIAISLLNDLKTSTFHVTANQHYTMETVTQIIHKIFGYEFKYMDIDGFVDHVNFYCTKEDDLYPLLQFFNTNKEKLKAMGDKRYDNQNYKKACKLSRYGMMDPHLDETVRWIVLFLKREGLVPEIVGV